MLEPIVMLADEAATRSSAARLALLCNGGVMIDLHGDLGAGKTTWARGFLQALGVTEHVKSPTFTVVEPYVVGQRNIFHFDLYRLNDPEELELLGVRDYFAPDHVVLVEWPERGAGVLPEADLHVVLDFAGAGRRLTLRAGTARGESVVNSL